MTVLIASPKSPRLKTAHWVLFLQISLLKLRKFLKPLLFFTSRIFTPFARQFNDKTRLYFRNPLTYKGKPLHWCWPSGSQKLNT